MLPDLATRRRICEDTIARSSHTTSTTPGASLHSTVIDATTYPQLSPLDPSFPNLSLGNIKVIDSDTFACARTLVAASPDLRGKLAVLNLASDEEPGGGWRYTLSTTQEEALCYSSTLFQTLKMEWYPWPNTGEGSIKGIFSGNVVVFKDTLDNGCVELEEEERIVVSVVTVAAPRCPELTGDKMGFKEQRVLDEFREKVRLVLRCAAREGKIGLVLGALGCGAYRCPPGLVAREMKGVLAEEEFRVYGKGPVGERNFRVFQETFGGQN
ncbi:hypothetical protein E4T44_08925 [Aureobasidium sp. EXF-8845]|nr:hypothetical protein E4T44_08925 [Aureobasidium sp. EXF-8845]KAI4842962.1 hypothetical protein E4T45_08829 [Aureobasidium sp. EXF-8846]